MKSSNLKRILISVALVLIGIGTALAPAAPALARHQVDNRHQVETVAGNGSGTDDTPWG